MKGNREARIAKVEQIKAFSQVAAKNLAKRLASALETDASRQNVRRELFTVMETLDASERELAKLRAKE